MELISVKMVLNCFVPGCRSYGSDVQVKFFTFPTPRTNVKEETQKLMMQRRTKWITACLLDRNPKPYHRICSRHFVSGKPATLKDACNADWVPNLYLPLGLNHVQTAIQVSGNEHATEVELLFGSQTTADENNNNSDKAATLKDTCNVDWVSNFPCALDHHHHISDKLHVQTTTQVSENEHDLEEGVLFGSQITSDILDENNNN
ncbi:uncharacterized protein LOC129726579 [Wyeomyia smithii]|uniref:uncharacterized protein LOC129726579 n=1 Tax=Wyeomyia smithii TaxID=174621 RepID=UPI002467EDA9|nr:uncharacterized protein LOC129726579 [Wyeomyia smithii]